MIARRDECVEERGERDQELSKFELGRFDRPGPGARDVNRPFRKSDVSHRSCMRSWCGLQCRGIADKGDTARYKIDRVYKRGNKGERRETDMRARTPLRNITRTAQSGTIYARRDRNNSQSKRTEKREQTKQRKKARTHLVSRLRTLPSSIAFSSPESNAISLPTFEDAVKTSPSARCESTVTSRTNVLVRAIR